MAALLVAGLGAGAAGAAACGADEKCGTAPHAPGNPAPRPRCGPSTILDATNLGACLAGRCDWRPLAWDACDGRRGDLLEQVGFAVAVVFGAR